MKRRTLSFWTYTTTAVMTVAVPTLEGMPEDFEGVGLKSWLLLILALAIAWNNAVKSYLNTDVADDDNGKRYPDSLDEVQEQLMNGNG